MYRLIVTKYGLMIFAMTWVLTKISVVLMLMSEKKAHGSFLSSVLAEAIIFFFVFCYAWMADREKKTNMNVGTPAARMIPLNLLFYGVAVYSIAEMALKFGSKIVPEYEPFQQFLLGAIIMAGSSLAVAYTIKVYRQVAFGTT